MIDSEIALLIEEVGGERRSLNRLSAAVLVLLLAAPFSWAQSPAAHPAPKVQQRNSGPLAFVSSEVNPKTLFWIQGRFVPVENPTYQGKAEVDTIICSTRQSECIEVDSETFPPQSVQAWIQEYKVVSWDEGGILATSRSLTRCTDTTLKIRFAPLSVLSSNSPVLPMSERCKSLNHTFDKLMGEKGTALKGQLDQEMLVPTRGLAPFQDMNSSVRGKE